MWKTRPRTLSNASQIACSGPPVHGARRDEQGHVTRLRGLLYEAGHTTGRGSLDFTVPWCGFVPKVNKLTLAGVQLVHSIARPRRGGTNMRMWIRVLWTAAAVVAIAWPLLFWGKAAS